MGDFSEELKVSIIGDLSKLEDTISQAENKLKIFKDKQAQQTAIQLKVNIAELDSKLADARKRLSDYRKEGDKVGEIKTRLEISGLQQSKAAASKALKGLQDDAQQTEGFFDKLGATIQRAFAAFLGIQAAIRAVTFLKDQLVDSFNASVQFESAFAGIRKTVDATEEQFQQLSKGIIDMSKTIPVAATDLAKIGEAAGQLGVKQKDILEFTKTIAAIGVSTNLSQEEAATSFARIANIFQTPIANVSNLASSVVALGNNFATTETEIVAFTTRIAGAGKVAGLSQADLAGISAAFTSVGVEAEAGGTAVSKTLQTISDAVNKGGKDLNNFANVAGVSSKKFADLWKSNPAEAFELFVKGLGKSGQNASAILEDLVGGDQRLKSAFLRVASAGDLLTRAVSTANDEFEKNTALTTEANKRYETTESKLQALDNRWTALKIQMGNFLKEVALPVLDFFVTLAEALSGQQNKLSGVAQAIKIIGVPFVLLFKILQGIFDEISREIKAWQAFADAIGAATKENTILGAALRGIRDVLNAILGPLGALGNLLYKTAYGSDLLEESTKNLKKTLSDNFKVPGIQSLSNQFQDTIDKAQQTTKALQGLKSLQNAGFGNVTAPQQLGGENGATVNQTFNDTMAQSAGNVALLQGEITNLLGSLGATKDQISQVSTQLGIFNGATELSVEDQQILNQAIADQSPVMEKAAADFGATADAAVASGKTWSEGIEVAVAQTKKQYEANGQNAEAMVKTVEELYVGNVAKSGDLGKAAGVAYGTGLSASEARQAMESSVGTITDQQLLLELKAAELSGDKGKAAGLLYALGVADRKNIQQGLNSSKNLHTAIQNVFEGAKPSISKTGSTSGATLVSGIIAGVRAKIPALGGLLESITKALGGLGSFGGAFGKAAGAIIGPENVAKIQNFVGAVSNKAASLQSQFNALKNAKDDAFSEPSFKGGGGGGGGGGAGKGLDEAKKKAQEAEKAVDDFTKSIEDTNKSSEKLRDDLVSFYKDITNSIDKAREKQADLNGEFSKFQTEQTKDFATDTAKRDTDLQKNLDKAQKDKADLEAELQQEKDDLDAQKKKLQADDTTSSLKESQTLQNAIDAQALAQNKYNNALVKGTALEQQSAQIALNKANQNLAAAQTGVGKDSNDDQNKLNDLLTQSAKKQSELTQKIAEQEKSINDILAERQQIQDFLNKLSTDQVAAQKAYDEAVKSGNKSKIDSTKAVLDKATLDKAAFDAFTKQKDLETKTEFEQSQIILADKIAEKKAETDAEIAKQQRIIDIQDRFLELQNAKSQAEIKKKQDLVTLANTSDILSEQTKQEKLKQLGFDNLSVQEQQDLFKQVKTANNLEVELQQITEQQQKILTEKQKFQDLAEQYHAESVDKQKAKEQELIELIQKAQAEQIKLNSLRGIAGQASNTVNNTTNLNITNNNNSNVDAAANNNKLLSKIK
jgi:TP901 family phage tail tape measure protein